jgi:trk system potassium uptake protein TrkH
VSTRNLTTHEIDPDPASPASRLLLAAVGMLAAAALVLVYMQDELGPRARLALTAGQFILLGLLAAHRVVGLRRVTDATGYFHEHWLDLILLGAAALCITAGALHGGRILPAIGLYAMLSRPWHVFSARPLVRLLNVQLGLTGVVAVAALVMEYGFRPPLPVEPKVLHAVQTAVVAIFILDRLVRLELSIDRVAYFRENWLDFALMFAAGVAVAVAPIEAKVLSAGAVYLVITQGYILVSLVLRGVSVNLDFASSGLPPSWLLIGSFLFLCLAGSGLLMLPAATPPGHQPIFYYDDALFTAVSATCVTGLVVRNTGQDFTLFGQVVILGLIQLGGLGIMLFGTVLAMIVGRGVSVRSISTLGEMMGTQGIVRFRRIAMFVIAMTLLAEAVGAVLLYPMFAAPQGEHTPGVAEAVWLSVFHSISAFCNAGFSLYEKNMMAGVAEGWQTPLRQRWQMLGVIAPLIILGGIGFPVVEDCAAWLWRTARRVLGRANQPRPRLSLHSKVALSTTAALLVIGAGGLMLLGIKVEPPKLERSPYTGPGSAVKEDPQRFANMPFGARLRESAFQSVTARTAGFNTIDMDKDLTDAARLWMCGLMIVGGSPAGTAGGMKTVTLTVLILAAWSMIRQRKEIEAYKRTISAMLLRRAATVAVLYMMLVGAVTMLLCLAMPGWDFMQLFFEACSACGTVGLSAGITGQLGLMGKLVVIFGMFAGRVGPLTLLLAVATHIRPAKYTYPSETVLIG